MRPLPWLTVAIIFLVASCGVCNVLPTLLLLVIHGAVLLLRDHRARCAAAAAEDIRLIAAQVDTTITQLQAACLQTLKRLRDETPGR